jgi:hypothetical protein
MTATCSFEALELAALWCHVACKKTGVPYYKAVQASALTNINFTWLHNIHIIMLDETFLLPMCRIFNVFYCHLHHFMLSVVMLFPCDPEICLCQVAAYMFSVFQSYCLQRMIMQVYSSVWPLTNVMAIVVVLVEVTRWIFQTQPLVWIHCIMYCGGEYFYANFLSWWWLGFSGNPVSQIA